VFALAKANYPFACSPRAEALGYVSYIN